MQHVKFQRLCRLLLVVCVLSVALAQSVAAEAPGATQQRDPQAGYNPETKSFRIYAHREGLVGYTTANGHVIQPNDFFVALPCWCALSSKGGNEFQVKITYQGKSVTVPVWDVGPWNTEDNYWDAPEKRHFAGLPRGVPAAEAAYYDGYNGGRDGFDREVRSPAGMDIGDGAFYALGMTDSAWVDVQFLWLDNTLEGSAPEGPTREEIAASMPALQPRFSDIATVWWDESPPLENHVAPIEDGRYAYVAASGHNVPVEFMDYWQSHGNWKTLGFPVSEFHRAVERDGSVRYIQHFERSVLQMVWPEDGSAPTVVPVNLGYDTFIDPGAWIAVEPFNDDGWARYFPETSHSLGGGFRKVWEANGGAEVFGLPISEEWGAQTADGERVVYQVFERARFEWWPERSGDAAITFGLLGLELLLQEGWIEPAPAE